MSKPQTLPRSLRLALLAAAVLASASCSRDWPAFRHNSLRNAHQPNNSVLANPASVGSLHVVWQFTPPSAQAFRASPIVYDGRVYIGNANGRFYALRASDGALLWQYPAGGSAALTSPFTCNPSSNGIASSALIARIGGRDAVIFGAPDPSEPTGAGSGKLYALDAVTGTLIWKSAVVARLTGTTPTDLHEQIGYSAPIVFNDKVYVGVADHCDNPIQNGRVVAVNLADGSLAAGFAFQATSARGGGVWSSPAAWFTDSGRSLFVTTGNSNTGGPEPAVNHGLSVLKLNADTGAVQWKHQPVPYSMDFDPDWASGATYLSTTCGALVVSTMKDGWTHALDANTGACRWKFPNTPAGGCSFSPGDGTSHGDIRYLRPAAAWRDVFVTMNGGTTVTTDVTGGYARLHALNVCASHADRVRWLLDPPGTSGCAYSNYRLGPPTVTRGIVYVGTCSGRLIVAADPSIWPAAGWRCSNPNVANTDCAAQGFALVPQPAILANVQLSGAIMTEPVLARGRVFVGTGFWTDPGTLYMLQP